MRTWRKSCCRASYLFALRMAGVGLFALMLVAGESRAQQYAGQDGRLLDANPQLGGSGYNYARPTPPLIGGNLYATGNIGRGLSLRSFSPIGSATAFRATTGSGSLSNFIRDSVSIADQSSLLGGLVPRTFYDPAQTVPTGGYLRGFYASQPGYPFQDPLSQRSGAPSGTSALGGGLPFGSPPALRTDFGRSEQSLSDIFGARLNTELSSTIFGVAPPRLPSPLSNTAPLPQPMYLPEVGTDWPGTGLTPAANDDIHGPLDLRIGLESRMQSVPTLLDIITQESAIQALTESTVPTLPPASVVLSTAEMGFRRQVALATGMRPAGPGLFDTSVLPGNDIFTDMQLALALSRDPGAEWYADMLAATLKSPTAGPTESIEIQTRAAAAAEGFIERVLEAPVQTFVGESESAINDGLRQAEAAMELGRYYDAVRHYERVRVLDPGNPLPLIGRGHALLASGEYRSAAQSLISGLERFPELTRFEIDLTVLMGGGEVVDIRRANLMKQLARNEDPQLRFLLGYLEVHAGIFELGLENLDKAAQEARPGTLIRRYPDMLRRKGLLPPPKLPADAIRDFESGTAQPRATEPSAAGKESE